MSIRTRFAPSPTGYMHIGNLRTALYSYLVAKSQKGDFILRIEDTDQTRYVDGAVDVIYNTLKKSNLIWDEGPDVGGSCSPYVQSDRVKSGIYLEYAKQLVGQGDAYYCFCKEAKTDLDTYRDECNYVVGYGYNGHCRNLSKEEIKQNLNNNVPYVIRQKMPKDTNVTFNDLVFGEITINSNDLDDQVLIKQDGYPTYNFANVIDDHLMNISHIVRGCEYLSSTPKYNLLYKAFGWNIPKYVHLPLIMRQNENGEVEKLSKRNGCVSFEDFISNGYLAEAIINYIGLLGWSPKSNNEFFTFEDFVKQFSIKGINKSPSIFDENKLKWLNGKHIRKMTKEKFNEYAYSFSNVKNTILDKHWDKLAIILQNRISTFAEIPQHLDFFYDINDYDIEMFEIEKIGLTKDIANDILSDVFRIVFDKGVGYLKEELESKDYKKAHVLSTLRVALTGKESVVIDMYDIADILGNEETKNRIEKAMFKLA